MVALRESQSKRLLHFFQELLSLRLWKSNDQPSEARQDCIMITHLQTHSLQKIRADHLQIVASRLIAPKHETRCFKRLLNDRQLVLVGLEVENFPRFGFLSGQVFRYFSFEFLFGKFARFMQPGCTIEPLTARPGIFNLLLGLVFGKI